MAVSHGRCDLLSDSGMLNSVMNDDAQLPCLNHKYYCLIKMYSEIENYSSHVDIIGLKWHAEC